MTDHRRGSDRAPRPAPPSARTHGMHGSPTYKSWQAMKDRCSNARGAYGRIRIHAPWADSFVAFLRDMGERPSHAHSIDRIDNTGHYAPGNCRWATATVQNRNKGGLRIVSAFGESKPVAAWCEDARCRVGYQTLYARLGRGVSPEVAITTNARGAR